MTKKFFLSLHEGHAKIVKPYPGNGLIMIACTSCNTAFVTTRRQAVVALPGDPDIAALKGTYATTLMRRGEKHPVQIL